MYDRMTLQSWERLHRFIFDLTDMNGLGSTVPPSIRVAALELLRSFAEAA